MVCGLKELHTYTPQEVYKGHYLINGLYYHASCFLPLSELDENILMAKRHKNG
jgi:hypothetical protein